MMFVGTEKTITLTLEVNNLKAVLDLLYTEMNRIPPDRASYKSVLS